MNLCAPAVTLTARQQVLEQHNIDFVWLAGFSTLQMLTNIENRLEELFEQIEMMPQDKVEAAEKVRAISCCLLILYNLPS